MDLYPRTQRIRGQSLTLATTPLAVPLFKSRYCDAVSTTAWRYRLNENVQAVFLYDTSEETYTDYTSQATDGSVNTSVVLNSMADDDILYICLAKAYGGVWKPSQAEALTYTGVYFDVGNANGSNATMAVTYYSGSWANTTPTDGTAADGKTVAVDGAVTWAAKTDWVAVAVNGVTGYWIKMVPSGALDSTTSILSIAPCVNAADTDDGALAYIAANQVERFENMRPVLEAKAGGAATLLVNCRE